MALTHFDGKGDAHMVDVSDKPVTSRVAVAETHIKMLRETFDIITITFNFAASDFLV